MKFLMLALVLAQNPSVIVREPRPPSRWQQSTEAACGRTRIRFSGYGAAVHTGATPTVTIDGRALAGPRVPQLIADLSTVRGVYRFSVHCNRDGTITVTLIEGEAQSGGGVRYRSALARIRRGRLDFYSELEPADADTFWFR